MTFPLWFLVAIVGHLANGVAFLIDKTLLQSAFKRPATYAGAIGLIGILAVVLFPFGVQVPDAAGWMWMILSGATFVCALWIFFAALASGEASRVVPVVGSLIPIMTLGGTAAFLGEALTSQQLWGFALLVVATAILSGGGKSHLSARALRLAILAAVLFAFSSVTGKIAYEAYGFLSTFTWSRIAGALAAAVILACDPAALKEWMKALAPKPRTSSKKGRGALVLILVGQSLGSVGFLGVQYATSLGSAALVNALQAVQYAFLVLAAFFFRKRAPALLGESLIPATIAWKVVAIAIVAVGLWLIV